jgi:hypothetical protein
MRSLSLFFALVFCACLFGQLPETEIWLISLKKEKDSLYPGKTTNISQHKGYDNQPSFSLHSKSIFYVSADSLAQTDIIHFDLRSGKKRRLTQTGLSEYSPQEIKPNLLYAVVVEKDSSQRIHEINALSGVHQAILEPDSVGYYCFLNADTLVYYKLTEPHSLRTYSIKANKEVRLGVSPGRGFKAINAFTLVYCLKDSINTEVYEYNFRLQKAKLLSSFPAGSEDLFWHNQLGLLRSDGLKILQFREGDSGWRLLFDLSKFGFHRITRFAFDQHLKHLVIVDNL